MLPQDVRMNGFTSEIPRTAYCVRTSRQRNKAATFPWRQVLARNVSGEPFCGIITHTAGLAVVQVSCQLSEIIRSFLWKKEMIRTIWFTIVSNIVLINARFYVILGCKVFICFFCVTPMALRWWVAGVLGGVLETLTRCCCHIPGCCCNSLGPSHLCQIDLL